MIERCPFCNKRIYFLWEHSSNYLLNLMFNQKGIAPINNYPDLGTVFKANCHCRAKFSILFIDKYDPYNYKSQISFIIDDVFFRFIPDQKVIIVGDEHLIHQNTIISFTCETMQQLIFKCSIISDSMNFM